MSRATGTTGTGSIPGGGAGLADAGRRAERSGTLDVAARAGLVAYGVVNLLLGWIALTLAFGSQTATANTSGAMNELARQPLGTALVWAVAVGLFLLVAWRLMEAAYGHRDEEGAKRARKRLVSVGRAVIYGAVGVSAIRVAVHARSTGGRHGGETQDATSTVMGWPAGQWLVAVVGLAVVAYGALTAWKGWTDQHLEHLDAEGHRGDAGTTYRILGKVGYLGKGVSLALVGVLFVIAGVHHRSHQTGGLDRALSSLLQHPLGRVPIALIAVGLVCYGLFSFARARHLRR